MESPTLAEFRAVTERAYGALLKGELDRSLQLFEAARQLADECEEDVLDQAEVNLATIRVQVRQDDLAERGLREVLLRSANDDIVRSAAHALAKILSHRNEHEKAHRFAKVALEKAQAMGDALRIHSALALVGTIYGNQSYLDEALAHFEQALAILEENELPDPAQHAFYWVAYKDGIGYTLTLTGRAEEGRFHLEAALERAQMFGITDVVAEAGSDLCFAYLQLDRLSEATAAGQAALDIALEAGLPHLERNCYYLLGEVASRSGRPAEARDWFAKLQRFYPQVPFLADFLQEYDISSMINLKEFA